MTTMAMDDFSSLYCYQEAQNVEELNQKILLMAYELHTVRMQAQAEARKNSESMKDLLQLLQLAYKERDEANHQLQKLTLNKLNSPESPLIINNNAGATESNSFSDTTTNYTASPGDSLYDVISPAITPSPQSTGTGKITDPETQIIYNLAKGKTLPQKGMLLQSVMEAGPLLQTLMVAGPLPRWRNPPPLRLLQVPPVGFVGRSKQHAIGIDSGAHSVLNFAGLSNARGMLSVSPAGVGFGCQMIPTPKRQRIQ